MQHQNYNNHKKYYPAHHFIFLPLMGFLCVSGIYKSVTSTDKSLEWSLFAVLCFCILYLAIMLRQHYALGNQNRIVRLEFRLRYFQLYGESAGNVEAKLTFAQIAALRFANDQEYKQLIGRVLNEHLSSDEIKKSITNWQADNMRV